MQIPKISAAPMQTRQKTNAQPSFEGRHILGLRNADNIKPIADLLAKIKTKASNTVFDGKLTYVDVLMYHKSANKIKATTTSYLMVDCPEPTLDKFIKKEIKHINQNNTGIDSITNAIKGSVYTYSDASDLEPLEKIINPSYLKYIPFKKPK